MPQDQNRPLPATPPPSANAPTASQPHVDTAIIHYHRPDGDYGNPNSQRFSDFWGLHVWEGAVTPTQWQHPLKPSGEDEFGIYFVVPLDPTATELAYVLHRGERKDPGPDQFLQLNAGENEVFLVANPNVEQSYVFPTLPGSISGGDLSKQRAHWLTADTLAWGINHEAGMHYALYHSTDGELALDEGAIIGGTALPLHYAPDGLGADLIVKYPHLANYARLTLTATQSAIAAMLRGQLVIAAILDDIVINATGIQIPGVLDDLYTYNGALGVLIEAKQVTLRLWAPTAQAVYLRLFANPSERAEQRLPMTANHDGTWEVTGDCSWLGKYYRYEVKVYVPTTGRVTTNLVTDPYSLALATNSTHSQIIDLTDGSLKPAGWDTHSKPPLAAPTDIVLYELHLRDFSCNDASVPAALRGKYGAFTLADSNGMRHLRGLAAAGLTHIHLLPVFDIATINEDPAQRREPVIPADAPPNEDIQADAVRATQEVDGFNWGYDPHHYTVPEGSYATAAQGTARIIEFRQMVQALHGHGLRVVMDVVYNHTHGSGQGEKSVLDKLVPGYYHRLNAEGGIEKSTCCANTATEHAMMEKLMLDSLRVWAQQDGLDGFRFDLMGHHMQRNMVKVRAMLDEIDESIYIYGEGWDFGEVVNNARGVNATQFNLAGTGIGTFNDRLRNAVRGGRPFDNGDALVANQGLINGRWYAPNRYNGGYDWERLALLNLADQIRVGLAGNLADYTFEAADGTLSRGDEIDYYGGPTGYNAAPQENVVYVEAHDNQTLYDNNIYKLPLGTAMADRVRVQMLGMSFTMLAQGVPFLHAGIEMLRSKSLERDSYNSGDWFNRLFFDYTSNNFGVGLPVEAGFEAELMRHFLAMPALRADETAIRQSVANLHALLTIRKSSPLFRLRTKADVLARLTFQNTGPTQIPGVIAMTLADRVAGLPSIDPHYALIVVVFNATTETQMVQHDGWAGRGLALHPALKESGDPVVLEAVIDEHGVTKVSARTVGVFVSTSEKA